MKPTIHTSGLLSTPFQDWATSELSPALSDLIPHFLLAQRSPHTRTCYSRDLRECLEFWNNLGLEVTQVDAITERLLLLWQRHLEAKHAKHTGSGTGFVTATVARKLSTVSSLLTFAYKRGLLSKNPSSLITRPRVTPVQPTQALTREEVDKLLTYALSQCTEGCRSARLRYTIACTLFTVGLRVGELCELRVQDVDTQAQPPRLHLTTKGGGSHTPILHDATAAVLNTYREEFRGSAPPSAYFFVRCHGPETKLSQAAVYGALQILAQGAGLTKAISPHTCRATLATLLHNEGVPVGHIQDLLGHRQITTTALYIKRNDSLRDAASRKIDLIPQTPAGESLNFPDSKHR